MTLIKAPRGLCSADVHMALVSCGDVLRSHGSWQGGGGLGRLMRREQACFGWLLVGDRYVPSLLFLLYLLANILFPLCEQQVSQNPSVYQKQLPHVCSLSGIWLGTWWLNAPSCPHPHPPTDKPLGDTDVSSQHRIKFLSMLALPLCADPPFDPHFKYLNVDSIGGSKCCAAPSPRPEDTGLLIALLIQ